MPKKGAIVLVPFPFTDLSKNKVRPAVVISHNLKGEDVLIAFISSKKSRNPHSLDIKISSLDVTFPKTGLKTDSIIKIGKIATLDKKIILGELGCVDGNIEKEVNRKIKILFGL